MKILLLGDYSGLGKTLKEGLLELGYNVKLASNGDGWKAFPGADYILYPRNGKNIFEKIYNYIIYPSFLSRFKGYDVVQAPGTNIYFWGATSLPFDYILRNNCKFFINAAGVDYYLYHTWKEKKLKYDYYMYDDNPELCAESDGNSIASFFMNARCKRIMKKANGIIPVIPYEYEISYRNFSNLKPVILLPVNTDNIKYRETLINDKVIFFHGINRIKDKGSEYICKAMNRLKDRYPNDVECIISDRMPYARYMKELERANVIVDQCKSFGYGINACISMAMGKVVFSGSEQIIQEYFHNQCPVINIRPDVDYIFDQFIRLLDNKREIPYIGYQSRIHVEKNHDYKEIAQKYVDVWRS